MSPSLIMQMKEILSLIASLLRIIGIAMAKPPYLEMGVVVSFSEIFNRPATLEGAREILSQYKREAVLLVLAKLSAALRVWFRPDYQRDNGLARDVFKNARRAEAHSMAGNPRRLFFTRLGVLAAARLALSACNRPEASDITEPQQAAHVLACCLMMNELTSSTAPLTGVKNIPFLDDKPERADEKEAAFRRFFAELGARLFREAAGADQISVCYSWPHTLRQAAEAVTRSRTNFRPQLDESPYH